MKPYDHAKLSAEVFGGVTEDYIKIHEWFDQFRVCVANPLHRLFLHNTVGVIICEQVFGYKITNKDNKEISVRDIAEHHILTDVGEIRTPQEWLENIDNIEYLKPKKSKLERLYDKIEDDVNEKIAKEFQDLKKRINEPVIYPQPKIPDESDKYPWKNPGKLID